MKSSLRLPSLVVAGLLLAICAALSQPMLADGIPADPLIPTRHMISPEELVQLLKTQKPLMLYVGPKALYQQGHIPGAEYIGATSTPEGLEALRARVQSLAGASAEEWTPA